MFGRNLHAIFDGIISSLRYTQTLPLCSYTTGRRHHAEHDSKASPLYQLYEKKAQVFLEKMDEKLRNRKKRLEAEFEEYQIRGHPVPKSVPAYIWQRFLTVPSSRKSRRMYLAKLVEREKSSLEDGENTYQNTTDTTQLPCGLTFQEENEYLQNCANYASYRALVFGQPLIMDLDYEMSDFEQNRTFTRLMNCYKQNMAHKNPFHINFTGYKNSFFEDAVRIYGLKESWYASFHENNFTGLFKTSDMIYLSSEGHPLSDYDCEKIYVIGAYVTIPAKIDRTLTRARELGVEPRRLPLMDYGIQKRDLGLNTVMDIMLEASLCHSWEKAIYKSLVCTERCKELVQRDGTGTRNMWKDRYEKRQRQCGE